jgi:hypothetical protein
MVHLLTDPAARHISGPPSSSGLSNTASPSTGHRRLAERRGDHGPELGRGGVHSWLASDGYLVWRAPSISDTLLGGIELGRGGRVRCNRGLAASTSAGDAARC